LICFLLCHCYDDEIILTETAASNANVIQTLLRKEDVLFVCGLPFVCQLKSDARYVVHNTKISLAQMCSLLLLEDRDSFGSLNSSFLSMPSVVRINAGWSESEEQLFERFFAVGILLQSQKQRTRPTEIKESVILHHISISNSTKEHVSLLFFALCVLGPHGGFVEPLLKGCYVLNLFFSFVFILICISSSY
jgi:hypothetical protein